MISKEFKKFFRLGKLVKSDWTEETFYLTEEMEGKEVIHAVNTRNLQRYELLGAWMRNYENSEEFKKRFTEDGKNIEAVKAERASLIEVLRCSDISPANKVRFITSKYEELFEVEDLGTVIFDGKGKKVVYLDEYHFMFADTQVVYHVCEFAERAERTGSVVELPAIKAQ